MQAGRRHARQAHTHPSPRLCALVLVHSRGPRRRLGRLLAAARPVTAYPPRPPALAARRGLASETRMGESHPRPSMKVSVAQCQYQLLGAVH